MPHAATITARARYRAQFFCTWLLPAHVSFGLSADSTSNANMEVSIDSHLEVEDADDVLRGFGPSTA